jgi:transposase-like protein
MGPDEDTLMDKDNVVRLEDRIVRESRSVLEECLRRGARTMLQQAIDNEVSEYVRAHAGALGEDGRRLVVRNGYLPERDLVTGIGPVAVRQPRIRDGRPGERFTSKILPPFMRRIPSVDALIPVLYLKGISTGDFSEALEAILGPNAAGLSATNIVRLKEGWHKDYEAWAGRDLTAYSER